MDRSKWEYKKLGEVATFERGLTYSKNDESVSSTKGVLRSNNIDLDSHQLIFDEIKWLNESFEIPQSKKLSKDSIFICMSNGSKAHLGKVAFVDKDYEYAFGGFMGMIKPQNIYPKYLFYYFLSKDYRDGLEQIGKGANINNLRFAQLANFMIPNPILEDQQRIVAELDCLNEMIALKQEQLKEFDKLAQSIFYDMFGDKKFPMFQLKEVLSKIGSGATPSGGNQSYKTEGISLIRSLNVHNNLFVYKDLAFIDDQQAKQLNNVTIEDSDVLLNITGASVARCCVVPADVLPARVNQHVSILRPRKDILDSLYLCHLLISCDEQAKLISLSRSKAATREALPKNLIEKYMIKLPPLALQQQFAEKIQTIDEQKELVRKSIAETQHLLDSRMDYYFD